MDASRRPLRHGFQPKGPSLDVTYRTRVRASVEVPVSLAPRIHPDESALPRERVRFTTTTSSRSSVLVVTADGEVDAANALSLGKHVEGELESASRLIVDLRGLEFFGIQGFSIL